MKKLSKQKGFTLIELVVVIVILGILAVTAAPKFIDLTSDAKASVVQAVKGSINSSADMAHAKALITGKTAVAGATQFITVEGTDILLNYGWPTAAGMALLLVVEDVGSSVTGTTATYTHNDALVVLECFTSYNNINTATSVTANGVVRPTISSVVTDC
jgi:MSHA pilin protein MshA